MASEKLKTEISRWDIYSLLIIFFAVLIQILKWNLLPIFFDIYYHLLSASGFKEAGGWVHSCFWEYAPVGRPQLYPPVLHFFILFLLKTGLPFLAVGKLIQAAIYPILLFTIWYFIRSIFNKRQAFFVTLLTFSSYDFYLTALNTSAASLSLIFCLLSLLALEKRRTIAAVMLLAISFYTHGYTSWVFLGVFIFYGLSNKERFALAIRVALYTLCLASPLIIFQFLHRDYFFLQRDIIENYYFSFDVFNWLLLPFGLVACLRKKGRYFMFLALFISSFVFLIGGFVFRYMTFYGIIGIIFMNSVFLDDLFISLGKNKKIEFFTDAFLFCSVFAPTLNLDLSESKIFRVPRDIIYGKEELASPKGELFSIDYLDSNLMNLVLYCAKPNIRSNERSIYFPELFREVAEAINVNSSPGDIIYSNIYPLGGIMGLLTNRATSSAMLSEVKPYRNFDQVAAAKLIVWFKDPYNMEKEPTGLIRKYGLKKITDTKMAFIYDNPSSRFKKQTLSATLSYKVIFGLLILSFLLIVRSMKFGIDK